MKKIVYAFAVIFLTANLAIAAQPLQAPEDPAVPSTAAPATDGTNAGSAPAAPDAPSTSPSTAAPAAGGESGGAGDAPKAQSLPFAVYVDQGAKENHYIPSGWMGDYGDLKINPGSTETPHGGKNSFEVTYSAKMTQGAGWAGIFWQQPANNWGDKKGGFNLTGASRLSFWARGGKGGEKIAEFKVGGITGEYPDTDSATIGPIELTREWKQYTIDLKGKDLSTIIGGFAWAASKDDNPEGFKIYLDDIVYE